MESQGAAPPPTAPWETVQPDRVGNPCQPSPSPPQDLFSALIKGPTRTPYEDGLYLFDIQLPNIYPAVPPHFCYLSQCSGRLNPNLYDNGKVCVSLLGTWIGKVSTIPVRMGDSPWGTGVWDRVDHAMCVSGDREVDEQIQPSPGAHLHPRYSGWGRGVVRGGLLEGTTAGFVSPSPACRSGCPLGG